MAKKIVVITGSPRKRGNSFTMTDAFVRMAEKNGHLVTRFDTAFLNLSGCRACNTCYTTGKACSFDDDFNKIAPSIAEADVIVFTMPVYWYTIPAQIKNVIDKLYAFYASGTDISGKQCGLIACCEETDESVLAGVSTPIKRTAALVGWEVFGEVLISGVSEEGDIAKTDGCSQAAALAGKI